MPGTEIIEESLKKLIDYIESQNYRGYDPYDALKSPLFRLPVLRSNKKIRFTAQQLIKRCPVNFRAVLGIPKGYDPVTLGLCIQGYAYLAQSAGHRAQSKDLFSPSPNPTFSPSKHTQSHQLPNTDYRILITYSECIKRIEFLLAELKNLIPVGYKGACWGYDFPWEARYASIPARQPTVVATGIITNALYICYKVTGNKDCAELIKSSALFVLNDLNWSYEGDKFIFSYSPFDKQKVLNASMKGVRILAQAYSLTADEKMKSAAKKVVEFVNSKQRADGSWGYSVTPKGTWTDNYHTGYILDCLHEYNYLCNDQSFEENLKRGYEFYKHAFIGIDGMPGFYASKAYPADCTAAGQTILSLIRFGDREKALEVAVWMINNMQSRNGSFYYRKHRYYTVKTPFMRWSQAWMFTALSYLLKRSAATDH